MIFKTICILFFLTTTTQLKAQNSDFSVFKTLVGKTWKAEGLWGDGTHFKQSIEFSYGLDSTIVKSNTYSYTDSNQDNFGLRNEGIRRLDTATNTIQFWEFDIFGELTQGQVKTDGNSFYYQYQYGSSIVTDYWTYINDNTFQFQVGIYANGHWSQIFMTTIFVGF